MSISSSRVRATVALKEKREELEKTPDISLKKLWDDAQVRSILRRTAMSNSRFV